FSTWLHIVTANCARTTYRTLKRRAAEQSSDELFAEAFACVLTRRARRLIGLFGDEHAAQQAYTWLAGRYGIG
ncbi:hypothetical protein AB0M50_49925, partial [Nonomuraea fuscirosea]